MADTLLLNPILGSVLGFFAKTWFLWVPGALFFIFAEVWLNYVRALFISQLKWILLEVRVPREVAKSPKAMESILAGIHGTAKSADFIEKYWKGFVPPWFSLEIVGDETGVHFYIWTQEFFRKMIEAQVYAQYPSSEVTIVEDYTKNLPPAIPDERWNLWGTEFMLTRLDAYPIRTYEDFALEKISVKEEETKIDPLSALVEFMGLLTPGEKIWIQIIITPAGTEWKEAGEQLIAKITGREDKAVEFLPTQIVHGINAEIAKALGIESEQKREDKQSKLSNLTPGERDVLIAIEKNIGKLGFYTGIRWLYVAERDRYNGLAIPALMGIFKQFASPSMNGFKPNRAASTSAGYFRKKIIEARKKLRIYNAYRLRSFFALPYLGKKFVFNTSELATIYHFPGTVAGSPGLSRVEAKKGAPPTNLPI